MWDYSFSFIIYISYILSISDTFFAFSLRHLERSNMTIELQNNGECYLSWWVHFKIPIIVFCYIGRITLRLSLSTCISDVKASSSTSTYPSTLKSTSWDSRLSWKSSSCVSSNLKGSSSSDWLRTWLLKFLSTFLEQFAKVSCETHS